jgi:integrase
MSRRRSLSVPSYRKHKQSGQAIVTLTDGVGGRRDVLLGKYDTPESRAEYLRVLAEWEAAGRRAAGRADGAAPGLSVNELILRFWKWAETHYRDTGGGPSTELRDYKPTLRPLRELYGSAPAAEFSPLKLKAVRGRMVDAGLSRGVVNQRIGRIVRMFKWAVSEELVTESTWRALTTVRGLERGRSTARETEPVGPVADAVVDATLPFLTVPVRAMVKLQRLTGARPGEVCQMRGCDLDTTGAVWLYRPPRHKTAHRGKPRVIALGPQAQEVVKPFLRLDLQAFLFSPRAAIEHRQTELRSLRKTPVQPSQQNRKKRKPKRAPGERYTTMTYGKAIADACERAFPCPPPVGRAVGEKIKDWRGRLTPEQRAELRAWNAAHRWHPHQLRHTHATEVRRRYGLEAAQVALGHAQANVTEIYAERNLGLAVKVAAEIG